MPNHPEECKPETFYVCPKCGGEAAYQLVGDESWMTCSDCGFYSGDDSQFETVTEESPDAK